MNRTVILLAVVRYNTMPRAEVPSAESVTEYEPAAYRERRVLLGAVLPGTPPLTAFLTFISR